jgi:hypothetical protein
MKVEIPENLKQDVPPTLWGRILSATPVVMAVVATMLAGLSSSEMTRAQYARSLAAQQQSKAGDQWSFFQAKRLRATLHRNTIDLLHATGEVRPFPATGPAAEILAGGNLPDFPPATPVPPAIQSALDALETNESETGIAARLAAVTPADLHDAVAHVRQRAHDYEARLRPLNQAVDELERSLPAANRDFLAARLRYHALRYDAEARLNQAVAHLYELQVRQSNQTADRHHRRSLRFFFGMLAAQAGVIIATFAIAARQRNLLWTLAAVAGLIAIGFAVYVYLYV